MKKLLPVISGFLLGLILTFGMIMFEDQWRVLALNSVPAGEDPSWWDEDAYAVGQYYDWKTVFSEATIPGLNLYNTVRNNLVVEPQQQAVKMVAASYGLSVEEAQSFIDGSLTILNNNAGERTLDYGEVYAFREAFMSDYRAFQDTIDLEQELGSQATLTELFINDNMNDSGFDLLHDLKRIEEILFDDSEELSGGGKWPNFLNSAHDAAGDSGGSGAALLDFDGTARASNVVGIRLQEQAGEAAEVAAIVDLGNKEIETEILAEDVCVEANPLADANEAFQTKLAEETAGKNDNNGGDGGTNNGANARGELDANRPILNADGRVNGATPKVTKKQFCGPSSSSSAPADFGAFSSLSGSVDPQGAATAGIAAGVSGAGFAVDVAVCITVDLEMEGASSYVPGDNCIQCEIEKINKLMKQTLDHSLVPNKVTGNLMETAKCKAAFTPNVDMKVIAIPSPVPTPPNDDLLNETTIVDEWNKFVARQLGYKAGNFDQDESESFAAKIVTPGESQDSFYQAITSSQAYNRAEVENDLAALDLAGEANNLGLFNAALITEMRQMNNYFLNFQSLMSQDIYGDACRGILRKPNIN